ncbi:unnamed protein product [Soboliphyme baturini]|uniref:Uncharacterized protein n=1 Tax=Soboliphyme baturini TaxID=241478 RepID=A0A183J8Z3_9BILA|nr:unnamed protein product [Soboliphyme baturini]
MTVMTLNARMQRDKRIRGKSVVDRKRKPASDVTNKNEKVARRLEQRDEDERNEGNQGNEDNEEVRRKLPLAKGNGRRAKHTSEENNPRQKHKSSRRDRRNELIGARSFAAENSIRIGWMDLRIVVSGGVQSVDLVAGSRGRHLWKEVSLEFRCSALLNTLVDSCCCCELVKFNEKLAKC